MPYIPAALARRSIRSRKRAGTGSASICSNQVISQRSRSASPPSSGVERDLSGVSSTTTGSQTPRDCGRRHVAAGGLAVRVADSNPSPLAGEGGRRSLTDEGSRRPVGLPANKPSERPARPLIRPFGDGLLPQGRRKSKGASILRGKGGRPSSKAKRTPEPDAAELVHQLWPLTAATSAAKSSTFFSTPSPRARRTKPFTARLVPSALPVSATSCSMV